MRKIIKLFRDGNVCVTGLRGRGKDMLMANVAVRRKIKFVSNVDYDKSLYLPFDPKDFDCGLNTYENFIKGDVNYYEYPFPDGTDVYVSDVGIYFPAQYCNLLNRDYGHFATFMALSRQLGACNVHINVQNLNRAWDKIREQSDVYIMCMRCWVLFGKFVIQRVRIYEKYQSCVDRVPPYRVPKPWFNPDRMQRWRLDHQNYECAHGNIKARWLFYINKSNYNTRIFKEVLANGKRYS